MQHQKFQETHAQLTELGANLLQYLIEFREEELVSTSLDTVKADIENALSDLKEMRYRVAVVAPMKAGKSTFLNSMIGADLLASESAACTICQTEVHHIHSGETPRLVEYWHKDRVETLAEGNAQKIRETFLKRTRELRENRESNPETPYPQRFDVWHPIEAVQDLPALSGFTLIDTPGPNERGAGALKEATLEALRQCNVVIFVLNYRSVKDEASVDLFNAITKNRQELLQENKARIYFILNQIDSRSESDPPLEETLKKLRKELSQHGFLNPDIYPASALQGLLSKLIQAKTATEGQIIDFKNIFSAKYAQTNEEGDEVIPAPHKIAPRALQDSHIPEIQTKVFAAIIESAGWNLIAEKLCAFDKAARTIENTLNMEIQGLKQNISTLERQVKEYSQKSETARKKLEMVKARINQQQEHLTQGFEIAIDTFAEVAKHRIEREIENVAAARRSRYQYQEQATRRGSFFDDLVNSVKAVINTTFTFVPVSQFVSKLLEGIVDVVAEGSRSLLDDLDGKMQQASNLSDSSDPYRFSFLQAEPARRFHKQINDFCVPHLQSWWIEVKDRLVREGTQIQEELVDMIRSDVQQISNELSSYLGETLEIDFNTNPIQFPSCNFNVIDAQIAQLQERYTTVGYKKKHRGFSNMDEYEVPVETNQTRSVYEVDLKWVLTQFHQQIDERTRYSKNTLKRVVAKQIRDDFAVAEKQLEDFINRSDQQLKGLLEKRQSNLETAPQQIASLKREQAKLRDLLSRSEQMQEVLGCKCNKDKHQ